MAGFDIGNIYSRKTKKSKTYFLAIKRETLVTFINGKFGHFTTAKNNHTHEADMPVGELCERWAIPLDSFDEYMSKYFSPDRNALERARVAKGESLD